MTTRRKVMRQILAIGGGGGDTKGPGRLLDDYMLGLTGRRRPKICFLPTASGDAEKYIERFHEVFKGRRAEASHVALFRTSQVREIRKRLLSQDIIYVGGGSTANMLAVWRVQGVDRILHEAWRRGIVLAGVSAGMLCWYEESVTDSLGKPASALKDGLGFLKGSACPHYLSEGRRRPVYRRLVRTGVLADGVAAEDYVGLHYVGQKLVEAVSALPGPKAYRMEVREGKVVETEIETRTLGR